MPDGMLINDVQWKIGIRALAPACTDAGKRALRKAVEKGFEMTQSIVHVDTGRLKASGRIVETSSDEGVGFDVVYGGDDFGVDYAGWHELEYPYLAPGMEMGLGSFENEQDLLIGPFG